MSKINLIPEVRQQKLRAMQINRMVTSMAVVLGAITVAIILGLAGYAGVVTAQKNSIDGQITKVQDSLDTMKDLEATVSNLENGLNNIKSIIAGNKDWNQLLGLFEKYTPSDIQITSFSVDGGAVSLSLKGKTVESIDRFIASFSTAKNDKEENYFTNVIVNGYSKKDTGEVTFEAKFNLNEAAIW